MSLILYVNSSPSHIGKKIIYNLHDFTMSYDFESFRNKSIIVHGNILLSIINNKQTAAVLL